MRHSSLIQTKAVGISCILTALALACCSVGHAQTNSSKFVTMDELSHEAWLRNTRGVLYPTDNRLLPDHVVSREGELSLYADYNDPRLDGRVVLYLVNRTAESVQFHAQDGDICVQLETKNDQGEWVRAEPHENSFCGNSYRLTPILESGQHLRFLGYSPMNDQFFIRWLGYVPGEEEFLSLYGYLPVPNEQREIRYRHYSDGTGYELISNVGIGPVNQRDIDLSKQDDMAQRIQENKTIAEVVRGTISLEDAERAWEEIEEQFHDPFDTRDLISSLPYSRLPEQDILSRLEEWSRHRNAGVALRAKEALEYYKERLDEDWYKAATLK